MHLSLNVPCSLRFVLCPSSSYLEIILRWIVRTSKLCIARPAVPHQCIVERWTEWGRDMELEQQPMGPLRFYRLPLIFRIWTLTFYLSTLYWIGVIYIFLSGCLCCHDARRSSLTIQKWQKHCLIWELIFFKNIWELKLNPSLVYVQTQNSRNVDPKQRKGRSCPVVTQLRWGAVKRILLLRESYGTSICLWLRRIGLQYMYRCTAIVVSNIQYVHTAAV
jgi:hypothetical protein